MPSGSEWIFASPFLLAAFILALWLAARSFVEWVALASLVCGCSLLITGYALSYMNRLEQLTAWSVAGAMWLGFALVIGKKFRGKFLPTLQELPMPKWRAWRTIWQATGTLPRLCFVLCAVTCSLVSLVNGLLILIIPPANWDSLTYHLPRMAYYLQNKNLDIFPADYYPQVVFPKGATIFLIWTYLFSGRNENLLQGVQFVAYALCILLVYGIARQLSVQSVIAATGALLFGLLTSVILESTTVQNDLVLTAFVGIGVFFLLRLSKTGRVRDLVLAVLAFAAAAAVKNTFLLALPALVLVGAYCIWQSHFWLGSARRHLLLASLVIIVGSAVLVLPSGYIENWLVFANPLGPPDIISFESATDAPAPIEIETGLENVLRIGLDFVSLDGLPRVNSIVQIQHWLRFPLISLAQRLPFDLQNHPEFPQGGEGMSAARAFSYNRLPHSEEDLAYWGIAGFALVLPVVLGCAVGRWGTPTTRILAGASLICILTVAFALDYEAWHGRRVITSAFLGVPCVAWTLQRVWQHPARGSWFLRFAKVYLVVMIGLTCFSALTTVVFREPNTLYPRDPSSLWRVAGFSIANGKLSVDRLGLLMRNRQDDLAAMRAFDTLVPSNAIVATDIQDNTFEYVLFGEKLTRTILPLNSFWAGKQPVPARAEFLLYSRGHQTPHPGDIDLGAGWYLSRLIGSH